MEKERHTSQIKFSVYHLDKNRHAALIECQQTDYVISKIYDRHDFPIQL